MIKFIKKILLFLSPLVVLVCMIIPFWRYANMTGELDSIEKNLIKQREMNCLLGLGYNEQTIYYKCLNANYYRAPIIAVGSSRVMQFRKMYFASEFYNCGGVDGDSFCDYTNFLMNLDYTPETIVVGFDTWHFNPAFDDVPSSEYEYHEISEVDRSKMSLIKTIIRSWINRQWRAKDLYNYPNNIGFNGRVKDHGFMIDGSYYYGQIYRDSSTSHDYGFSDTLRRIEYGMSKFEYGDSVDSDALAQLEDFLKYCKDNNINVIAFFPPFAPTIYNDMIESGKYTYINYASEECEELFSQYDCEFYDYTDISGLGVTDEYFIDGFHGSEVAYGYMVIDMIENGSAISKYVDDELLCGILAQSYSSLSFYDPDFGGR